MYLDLQQKLFLDFVKKTNDNTTYQQQRHSDGQGNEWGWGQQKQRRG
jgi:hypothetical protein